jgi:hypothetical protein
MTTYQIENTVSGLILGTYEAADEQGALDALARDAGYADHAAALAVTGEDGSDLEVRAVEEPTESARG